MTQILTFLKIYFYLSENELSDIDGGLAPLVIFGVAVSWGRLSGGTALIGSGLAELVFLGGD